MSHLRRARLRSRPASDHERARRLAAESLYDPLGPEQAAWLGDHLADCAACTAVVAEYVAQREALRALPRAEPPRDLWARTSAALDAEQRHAAAGRRGRSVFERRLVPYGALAGALVVAVVVTTSLFSTGLGLLGVNVQPPSSGGPTIALPSVAAAPTPLSIAAADVAWLAPQSDGTYALNVAPVDRVCPPDAQPDCAPIDGSGDSVVHLSAAPRAVVQSPSQAQFVVVDAATRSVGGAVYVVQAEAPGASPTPGASGTPIPIATEAPPPSSTPSEGIVVLPTPPPSTSSGPSESMPPTPPTTPPPSAPPSDTPAPSGSAAPVDSSAPSGSPMPSALASGAVLAIATDVVVVGETAAYSPDGAWFAFTARPADGSRGPDIYVWHVGGEIAVPVTSDHASVFSAWLGSLILGSRAVPNDDTAVGGEVAAPSDGSLPGGAAPAGTPVTTPEPATAPSAAPGDGSGSATSVPAEPGESDATGLESPSPSPVVPTATPASFLLDPASGGRADLSGAAWRPVLDPSGRYVVYWTGTLGLDAASNTWTPLVGQLVIAPWSWLVTPAAIEPTPPDGILPSPFPGSTSPDGAASSAPEPPTEIPPPSPGISPLGTPELATPTPGAGASGAEGDGGGPASPSATPFTPLTSPDALLPPDATGQSSPVVNDWEARWDPTGTHLAVWIADALDPKVGRLSLLTIDQATGRVDRARSLLLDAPALSGFSIADGRLAWATPPGQDAEGSRLQVLGWNDAGIGQLDSLPAMGPDEVVVVR